MREQIEPENVFDDTYQDNQDETRPALGDEARRAFEIANARRSSQKPLIDRDAETSAMMPNDYQKALQRLQQARAPGASQPPPMMHPMMHQASRVPKPDESDPAMALAQLTRQRDTGAPAPAPPSKPSSVNGTGSNRAISRPPEQDIPSAKDLAANVARRSLASLTGPPFQPQPLPPQPTDDPAVIANLLGQPSTQSVTSHTAPMLVNQLAMKGAQPGTALSPQRTPAPIAVGGGGLGGLKINAERPASMPPAGFGVSKAPNPAAPISTPARPMNAASRPPGALPRSTPPNATPAKQYDFKRWSSPEINEMPTDGSPVTFEVYTAQDVANGRRPMRSLPMIEERPKSSGIALKIGLAIVGIVIVLITAGAVIMVSTDEPKRPAPATPPSASASLDPLGSLTAPAPTTPSTIVIGDPVPPPAVDSAPPVSTVAPAAPAPKPKPKPLPAPAAPAPKPAPVLPSNPYGAPG